MKNVFLSEVLGRVILDLPLLLFSACRLANIRIRFGQVDGPAVFSITVSLSKSDTIALLHMRSKAGRRVLVATSNEKREANIKSMIK